MRQRQRKQHRFATLEGKRLLVFCVLSLILVIAGCGGKSAVPRVSPRKMPETGLAVMGYSIQIGAFSNPDNAIRLTRILEANGVDAYYFVHKTGTYKVRFGDFPSKQAARTKAETVRAAGIIHEYYLVNPHDYAVAKQRKYGRSYLRKEIVKTARHFIGLPYQWGGSSPDRGFDCSGLTMAVYRINGLNLPRTSKEQYRAGIPIKKGQLKSGDLVFFATSKRKRVSHVGIYTGDNTFIHAPGKGRRICAASLSKRYFKTRYAGARTYVR
ncbi:MAG: NlpC/P60 family protein [Desulfobacterales bacterium]